MNIKQYQDELLNIYQFTLTVFKKYDIKCIAHSGTLLGILRHNNDFIPWDDDIDILVPYNKLIQNYEKISSEINSSEGKFWIFNFIGPKAEINTNLFMLRVYSRKSLLVNIGSSAVIKRPFIDIFVGIPNNAFKTKLGWKIYGLHHRMYWMTRKGFNRFKGTVNNKKRAFLRNLLSYPVKILFHPERETKIIMKKYQEHYEDWGIIHRADCWSGRKISYDMDKLVKTELRGAEIWINNNHLEEIVETFGKDWKIEKETHDHLLSNKHLFHERNIAVNHFLDNLNSNYEK